ncbi:MAG: inositol monophosphatase family protein [Deinococcales bacterium]
MTSLPHADSYQSYLNTAILAAEAAAKIHQHYAGGQLDIATKSSDSDLVTQADKESEAKIREIILSKYPDHTVLGEEQGQSLGESRYRWIVDPLDGTLNYAHGFPFYCVSIALEIEGQVVVGVVLDSVHHELFSAMHGQGAFCNGRPIKTTNQRQLSQSMLATGFSYHQPTLLENVDLFKKVHLQCRAVRRPGAAALDLCYVACGRLDGFWELKLNAWDVAAGILIVQEAGGSVTDGLGFPYQFEAPVIVASNGHLHHRLVQALELTPPQERVFHA